MYCTCTSSVNFTSTCTYVDDNKNVRIRLKNILFEYTYTVMYLECRFRNQNQNDAILHCIKKHCYSGLIPSHILICASGHQVNLISYREKIGILYTDILRYGFSVLVLPEAVHYGQA